MSDQYLGEIRIVAFNFAPKGWAMCNGQLLSIAQNTALFAILGTTYGGNGINTFGLPDLRGRAPLHTNQNGTFVLGQRSGEESHTLLTSEMPQHNHLVNVNSTSATSSTPKGSFLGNAQESNYATASNTTMAPQAIGTVGGSQPHENRPPFLVLTMCIALVGIFPTRN